MNLAQAIDATAVREGLLRNPERRRPSAPDEPSPAVHALPGHRARQIRDFLLREGGAKPLDLARGIGITQSNASMHLSLLAKRKLVAKPATHGGKWTWTGA